MHDGGPALQPVVAVAMKQIGYADGGGGACGFDSGEARVIVHHVIVEQNFMVAAATHVQCGRKIKPARTGDAGEEPAVGLVPESVLVLARHGNFGCRRRELLG